MTRPSLPAFATVTLTLSLALAASTALAGENKGCGRYAGLFNWDHFTEGSELTKFLPLDDCSKIAIGTVGSGPGGATRSNVTLTTDGKLRDYPGAPGVKYKAVFTDHQLRIERFDGDEPGVRTTYTLMPDGGSMNQARFILTKPPKRLGKTRFLIRMDERPSDPRDPKVADAPGSKAVVEDGRGYTQTEEEAREASSLAPR
jgi:hypothetical protein